MIKEVNNKQIALFSFFFAIAAIFLFGYQFNNGDQEEHLPYVYKLLNPSLYPTDYIVPLQTSQFTVRIYFAWFVYFLSYLGSVESVVFIVHFICLVVVNWSVTTMAIRRSSSAWTLVCTPLIIFLMNQVPLGGNGLLDIQLTCSMPALALGLAGLNSFDAGKFKQSFLLIGLSANFQVLMGMQLGGLLLLSMLTLREKYKFREVITSFLVLIISAAPMLIPILIRQFGPVGNYNKTAYFNILFLFRNAHHYAPQCFVGLKYLGFFIISFLSFLLLKRKKVGNEYLQVLMIWVIIGCIVYSVGFILFESESVAKTQWFKSLVWFYYTVCVLFSSYVASVIHLSFPMKKMAALGLSLSIIVIFMIFNSDSIPVDKLRYRYKVGNYPKADLQLMHEWINSNLPIEAKVLSFPGDDSFLCEAKRSTPVGFKAIIHEPQFIFPWYENIRKFYGISTGDFTCQVKMTALADSIYNSRSLAGIIPEDLPDYRLMKMEEDRVASVRVGDTVKIIGNFILFRIK